VFVSVADLIIPLAEDYVEMTKWMTVIGDMGRTLTLIVLTRFKGRSQWPRGLRCGSRAARVLRLWVRIPPGAWMFVCGECFVLSGRGLCDGLITRPGKSYGMWRVIVCDQETSHARRLKLARGL